MWWPPRDTFCTVADFCPLEQNTSTEPIRQALDLISFFYMHFRRRMETGLYEVPEKTVCEKLHEEFT